MASLAIWKYGSLSRKILLLVRLPLLVLGVVNSAAYLVALRSNTLQAKQDGVKGVVENAYSIMASQEELATKGGLSREVAQNRSKELIKALRYEGNNYIWIQMPGSRVVMHPFRLEMDGTDVSTYKDSQGMRLFLAFEEAVRKDGQGFVAYRLTRSGRGGEFPKVSFVKRFAAWDWTV